MTLDWGAFIFAVADACTICEGFSLGAEGFWVVEVNGVIGVEVFFEALDVAVLGEVDNNGVCKDINFDWHISWVFKVLYI